MKTRTRRGLASLTTAALIAASGLLVAPTAQAAEGTNSLAAVLTAKKSFDTDKTNFDIVTAAVLAVLAAKPASPVKVLTDGTTAVTAFIPNDGAFINLVTALTGTAPATEALTFAAVAGLGIDTVETVLLYHVVPGAAILSPDALKANGAKLTTAATGKTIDVSVKGTVITLGDYDVIAADPKVILANVDINKGNKQIAHGIDAVLLPVQLLKLGTKSLAAVLTAKNSFDKNRKNFDIVTAAILAVLKEKPNSAVKVLTDGNVALTAFIPTDSAFIKLVNSLTGKSPITEAAAFKVVASLGIPAVENILLYHVVPGDAILSPAALKANGATLVTALTGKTIKVSVRGTRISLADYNMKLNNPFVILSLLDINKGNKQIAHGIGYVLLPTP